MTFLIIWAISLQVACIAVVVQVARAKKRDAIMWGILTLWLGIFAVAFIAVVPALTGEEAAERAAAVRRYPSTTRSSDGAAI